MFGVASRFGVAAAVRLLAAVATAGADGGNTDNGTLLGHFTGYATDTFGAGAVHRLQRDCGHLEQRQVLNTSASP